MMRDSLFPADKKFGRPYETLLALQSLYMYLNHIDGYLVTLTPAVQVLWDHDFIDAVGYCVTQVQRRLACVKQQLKVKSPQTLLVPTTPHMNADT